jgi:hypothetical protein
VRGRLTAGFRPLPTNLQTFIGMTILSCGPGKPFYGFGSLFCYQVRALLTNSLPELCTCSIVYILY